MILSIHCIQATVLAVGEGQYSVHLQEHQSQHRERDYVHSDILPVGGPLKIALVADKDGLRTLDPECIEQADKHR